MFDRTPAEMNLSSHEDEEDSEDDCTIILQGRLVGSESFPKSDEKTERPRNVKSSIEKPFSERTNESKREKGQRTM